MSTIEYTLPELGDDVEAGTVIKLLVAEGDAVAAEQPLMEVEIDKATVELPAPAAGTVQRLAVGEGDEVRVGQLVLVLSTTNGAAPAPKADARPATAEKAPPKPAAAKPAPVAAPPAAPASSPSLGTLPAGPAVRRLARLLGIELHSVRGSGQRGRITVEDVQEHLKRLGAQASSGGGRAPLPRMPDFSKWGPIDEQKISTFRRRTAEAMARSWDTIPHVTNFDEADTTDLDAGRRAFRKANPKAPRVTLTVLIAKACAVALKTHPEVGSSIDLVAGKQIFKHYVHIGIAVDTDYGLLVPVLRDVDKKPVLQLASELDDLAQRTRERRVKPGELKGATFTISNLGGIGGTGFTPIVNWPQVAILGVARGGKRFVPDSEGNPVLRMFTPLCLSYDHRVVDGALAARFLKTLSGLLSNPTRLLLEI